MKKTRWIACLIAVLLAVSLFPFGVFAESDDACLAPVFCGHQETVPVDGVQSVRLIALAQNLAGSVLGYEVTVALCDGSIYRTVEFSGAPTEGSTVWGSLLGNTETGLRTYTAAELAREHGLEQAAGIFAMVIDKVPTTLGKLVFTVRAYVKDEAGNKVSSADSVFVLENGAAAGNVQVLTDADALTEVLNNGKADGSYVVNTPALDLSGKTYAGLGTKSAPFTGRFDFLGCRLSGLSAPLFPFTKGATVENLRVAKTDIEYYDNKGDKWTPYGLIISKMQGGVVRNILLEKDVQLTVDLPGENSRIGGIIGIMEGATDAVEISDCISYATLTTNQSTKIWMGGIVGYINVGDTIAVTLTRCINYGAVTDNGVENDSKIAGVLGAAKSKKLVLQYCANYGSITATEEKGQAAGICSYLATGGARVEFCINGGTVSGGDYTGGILGYCKFQNLVVRHCLNLASVSGENAAQCAAIFGRANGGGVIQSCIALTGSNATLANCAAGVTVSDSAFCETLDALTERILASDAMKTVFERSGETVIFVKQ